MDYLKRHKYSFAISFLITVAIFTTFFYSHSLNFVDFYNFIFSWSVLSILMLWIILYLIICAYVSIFTHLHFFSMGGKKPSASPLKQIILWVVFIVLTITSVAVAFFIYTVVINMFNIYNAPLNLPNLP